ncbi:MAG: hypothetical protein WB661_06240 [Candidatus Bathyarchaeia archaeon]
MSPHAAMATTMAMTTTIVTTPTTRSITKATTMAKMTTIVRKGKIRSRANHKAIRLDIVFHISGR